MPLNLGRGRYLLLCVRVYLYSCIAFAIQMETELGRYHRLRGAHSVDRSVCRSILLVESWRCLMAFGACPRIVSEI
jgi:hypothetical protein